MGKRTKRTSSGIPTEAEIQAWLSKTIAAGKLKDVIRGKEALEMAQEEGSDFLPAFPIDYLVRMRTLRSAKTVLGHLYGLVPISTSKSSISRSRGEALFVDLLFICREDPRFIAFEIKRERATARETVTELMAYEHEILNHLPFASSHDVNFVVVSAEYSPLLDHAICNLICWGRRQVLCFRYVHSENDAHLVIHLPTAWSAVGQRALPPDGLQTAHLCLDPNPDLDEGELRAVFKTAAQILAREAERAGGSGFVMVVEDHLYPKIATAPFQLIAGALNPYCFLAEAESHGFVTASDSPIAEYLLAPTNREELTLSWNWIGVGGALASKFLDQFGSATWEGLSSWSNLRDPRRWRMNSITPDRTLTPLSMEFWGVLGDYVRDIVIQRDRLKAFMPGMVRAGMDWQQPHFGVMLLDEVGIPSIAEGGQWTFSDLFELGVRLGRWLSISASFAEGNDDQKRMMQAGVFWAEADLIRPLNELLWRYQAAKDIKKPPPRIAFGQYDSAVGIQERGRALIQWIAKEFIGDEQKLLQHCFATGYQAHVLSDPLFDPDGTNEGIAAVRARIVKTARMWLEGSLNSYFDGTLGERDARRLESLFKAAFPKMIRLEDGRSRSVEAATGLSDEATIDALFLFIPKMMGCCCPQLFHTLADSSAIPIDWDWYKSQIQAHRARGIKRPCVFRTPAGAIGIGTLPDSVPGVPMINDAENEVLFADNQTAAEIIIRMTWDGLRKMFSPKPVKRQRKR